MDLNGIRKEIDIVNSDMIGLFSKRMDLVKDIAEYKSKNGIMVMDSERERLLIDEMLKKVAPGYKPYAERFIKSLLSVSREMQNDIIREKKADKTKPQVPQKNGLPTVAYLGIPGSFSEAAVIEYFGENADPKPAQTFGEIIKGVESGAFDMAAIPVENSSTGSVNQSVDLLVNHDVSITGEHIVKVRHFLLGVKGSSVSDIEKVTSHPQALEQCREYTSDKGFLEIPCKSTAGAAQEVADKGDITIAAIASKRAAELYGLDILKEDIQTNDSNYTRFVVISGNPIEDSLADKISIICAIEHKPGSLHGLIDIFSRHGLNLLQLFSRPINDRPWEYRFHLDFAGSLKDESVTCALAEARAYCTELKLLGNYRSHING